jgi:xanthine dehydrogenase YagS FAD-binding subunit
VRAFELHEPRSVDEAIEILHSHGAAARPLGGGTDLVAGVMRDQLIGPGMPYPSHLVDLTTVDGLTGIRVDEDGVSIGAATPLIEISDSPELAAFWPLLTEAAGAVATPEIRALGTLGGNLHQRPRCWFFRNKDFDCIKKGGDICYAVKGDNRYNAIAGGRLCYIVHPSDLAMALLALGATAVVASAEGLRSIAFDDYFVGPEQDLLKETVLAPDELLVEVRVPRQATATHQGWRKLNEKGLPTWDFAVVSAAVVIHAPDGVWRSGRIVLGGVAPVPYRASVVEQALSNSGDIKDSLADASSALRSVVRPMGRNSFKVGLAELVLEQAVLAALARDPVPPACPSSVIAS